MIRIADTSLDTSEKEDNESTRLMHHRPPPSRKYREKRAPRPEQRRRRIKEDDPDFKKRRNDRGGSSMIDDDKLDRMLKGLDSYFKDTDDDDELEDFDFDAAIGKLDPADKKEAEKLVEEAPEEAYDYIAELLRRTQYDLGELGRPVDKFAASNEISGLMLTRTGTYHGVRDVRGNPTDPPNTGHKSYDKRYFTDKDYDLIVKNAAKILDTGWLSYGWDGGAEDAPIRAALDLSIQTANDCLYQSKIDSETYDLLLNRLAKWGHDTFSDTVLPMKASSGDKRTASMIKNSAEYKSMVHIANDLRQKDPRAALEILKNLRSLVASDSEPVPTISEHVAAEPAPKAVVASEIAEVPLATLLRVAASSQAAKLALGPFILAAAKKKTPKGKKVEKTESKKALPPEFIKNQKKGPPKGKKKKASISVEDASW